MTDVYSQAAIESLMSVPTSYVIRIDIPLSIDSPDTTVIQSGVDSVEECDSFVNRNLAEVLGDATWTLNAQCRIWTNHPPAGLKLVFDLFTVPEMVIQKMKEFVRTAPHHEIVPSPTARHEKTRRDLGGPFDSDHAMLVAINNRAFGSRGGER